MNKILSFIVNNENQILLLRNNPIDPKHGGDFWYTVTGSVEEYDQSLEEAVVREIKEETNLNVNECIYLNLILIYINENIQYEEYVHISFVNNVDNIILDEEENIDFKWCSLEEVINKIKWYGDRTYLRPLLTTAINKETYFNKEIIERV